MKCKSDLITTLFENLEDLKDIYLLIDSSINDESPVTIREGNVIKSDLTKRLIN
jgi:DNA mismatch repair protein MutS